MHGQTVVRFDKNLYVLRGDMEAPTTKLFISNIPISVDDGEIRNLQRLGCAIQNPIVSKRARNNDGKLTRFLTGRRFVFIEIPSSPLQRSVELGPFRATLYHRKMRAKEKKKCGKCLQTGHTALICISNIVCHSCFNSLMMCRCLSISIPPMQNDVRKLKH